MTPVARKFVIGASGFLGSHVARDLLLSLSVRLMHIMSLMDHGKAERELGWRPQPIHGSIRRGVDFYQTR
jgi:dihydroflavonol-4-reductase